jgi:hypothetical protein
MRYLIITIALCISIGCNGGPIETTAPSELDLMPPAKQAAWDIGTEMGEQDLLVYFTSHWSESWWGYDHPEICGLWWMVYDMLVERQLSDEQYVFNLVKLQEAQGNGIDVPDELDIEPPC